MKRGLVVDLFAGGGGASTGLEAALGRPVDIAINHDALALAVHKANHPKTKHLEANIWEVRPQEAVGGRAVDILWASPDCFPAGTMILTEQGYRPIEEIRVGDRVLTHKGTWRPVTRTMRANKPLIKVRGHGHPGLSVSAEHPFYERHRSRKWNNARRSYDRILSPATWTRAHELGDGCYWAAPCEFAPLPIPEVAGRGMTIDARLMWLAGRYLGDGWSRITKERAELVIVCGKTETEELRELLGQWARSGRRAAGGELAWHDRTVRTGHQFSTNHRGLVTWLREQFGHGAGSKRIPGWALGMDAALRQALLEGYMSADGYHRPMRQEATTVSRALAFGVKALANSLGKPVTVYLNEAQPNVIEGRPVNVRPVYSVRWRHTLDPKHSQVVRENGIEWCPIREVTRESATVYTVFNLSVEGDESYIAESVIVHNCTHFSVAKGDVPRSKKIRSLAWAVARWARAVTPTLIFVENVMEFRGWGPLGKDGKPNKTRMGETFKRWCAQLVRLGYQLDYRILDASLYGAPTRRRRLFMIARRDGVAPAFPETTHGPGKLPLHTAAECIEWWREVRSIFERKKPLAEKTQWRIAQGIRRFVLENPRPFVVGVGGRAGQSLATASEAPIGTVTAKNDRALLVPSLMKFRHESEGAPIDAPLPTVTAGGKPRPERMATGNPLGLLVPSLLKMRGEAHSSGIEAPVPTVTAGGNAGGHTLGLMAPTLVQMSHGEGAGKTKRRGRPAFPLSEPLPTQSASNDFAVMAPSLVKVNHGKADPRSESLEDPLTTVTAQQRGHALTAATMIQTGYGEREGQAARVPHVDKPLGTLMAEGQKHALVSAFLEKGFGEVPGRWKGASSQPIDRPAPTITSRDHNNLAAAHLVRFNHDNHGVDVEAPMPTVTSGGHHIAEVRAFLTVFYGTDGPKGQSVLDPMRTITAKHRLGLVTIEGHEYQIVDIGMRMLEPSELKRAQFGRFAEGYDLSAAKTKTAQVRLIGNSVCPEIAEAIVRANVTVAAKERVA